MRDDVMATLNDLIGACKDGEDGFKTCAEDSRDSGLRQSFLNLAESCHEAASELTLLMITRGGKPEPRTTISGTLHRRWLDIKSSLKGKDEDALMRECERGEEQSLKSYRRALEQDLPLDVRAVVERQYQGVIQNHELIKSLRDRSHCL